ncbi:MAG: B12-binding domain-containing radical SAM protein [Fidelibacterota bacterium]|nr:MAG: B12-binding domain-containing radical SAM protein [Candidatus Neomarinimicrobiota bacterium]
MKYHNVLCIYPYQTKVRELRFSPPLGLEYIVAAIDDLVDKITVIDMRFEDDITKFIQNDTDLVCISVNWGFEKSYVHEIINQIPQQIFTVVGGSYASLYMDEFFQKCSNLDVIVRGDGEETIRELIESGSPSGVKGLSYRYQGRVVNNENRVQLPLSNVLFPNRELRRQKYKIPLDGVNKGIEIDSIYTSRGCPFNCKFCYLNIIRYGEKRPWSARTPESIVKELKSVDADLIIIVDDNFAHDMDRVDRICQLLINEGVKKKFIAQVRIDVAKRPEVLRNMYKAGFKILWIGIESAKDETLKFYSKGFQIREVTEAFKVLRGFNFFYIGFFIIGNMGEDEKDMMLIPKLACELGIDALSLSILRVEKDSPLECKIADSDNYHIARDEKVYSDEYPIHDLRRIQKRIKTEFYGSTHLLKVIIKLIRNRTIGVTVLLSILRALIQKQQEKKLRGSGKK